MAGLAPLRVGLLDGSAGSAARFFPFHDLEQLAAGTGSSGGLGDQRFSRPALVEPAADGTPEVRLFSTGCRLDGGGGGAPDCSRACANDTLLFGSLDTFFNCAALAAVAYWARDGRRFAISPQAERNASFLMGAGADAGTASLAAFDERPVLASFVSCAREACGGDGIRATCDDAVKALTPDSPAPDIFDAINSFCPEIAAELNPDIFGPGVLLSYVLQVSFASLLYLATRAFTLYVSLAERGRLQCHRDDARGRDTGSGQGTEMDPGPGSGPRRSTGTAAGDGASSLRLQRHLTRIETLIWRDSSALSRTSVAIATTLVEFQEAQCWFVFAIQIASILAIVVNSQEGTFWGEIMVNAAVAFHVSQNGILPMFLVQICLHNEGIRNWHTFIGFLVEYLLAIVATTQKVYFIDAFNLFRKDQALDACGGNPSPRSYCTSMHGVEGLSLTFFPRPLLYKMVFVVLDTIAIVILVLDQMTWTLRTHRRTRHINVGGFRPGHGPAGRFGPAWVRFRRAVWLALELAYLVINLLYMVSLIRVFNADSFEASKWSYGQIIAMTVWGPVIVKLFDLVLSGPPKNGTSLNSGPPRLRIDNIINRRLGTSAEEDEELEHIDSPCAPRPEQETPRPRALDLGRSRNHAREAADTDDGLSMETKRRDPDD